MISPLHSLENIVITTLEGWLGDAEEHINKDHEPITPDTRFVDDLNFRNIDFEDFAQSVELHPRIRMNGGAKDIEIESGNDFPNTVREFIELVRPQVSVIPQRDAPEYGSGGGTPGQMNR